MSYKKPGIVHDGVRYPPQVTREILEAMKTFQTRDDDIAIVSYPKTGTNWTLEIVTQILQATGRSAANSDDHLIGKLEFHYPENPHPSYVLLEDAPSPREKILVVMRNPKDTAVSYYHHCLKCRNIDANQLPWPKYFQDALAGKEEYGSFFDHVLSWWEKRGDPHFIFLKYEDMKKDIASEVKKIVKFLEADLDAATIAGIAEKCTFEGMKATLDNSRYSGRRVNARKVGRGSAAAAPKRTRPNLDRVDTRLPKGVRVVGDWKNYFTDEQNQAFDAQYDEKLKGTGLDFEFE
ncbi:sulfotransferase 1 [Branchiostoma belcheri]|nr:sulfotransferase 1 [Branchiostoma belcheri]